MNNSIFDRAHISGQYIQQRVPSPIQIAIVLGSGLGAFAEALTDPVIIPYEEIPDFMHSTARSSLP